MPSEESPHKAFTRRFAAWLRRNVDQLTMDNNTLSAAEDSKEFERTVLLPLRIFMILEMCDPQKEDVRTRLGIMRDYFTQGIDDYFAEQIANQQNADAEVQWYRKLTYRWQRMKALVEEQINQLEEKQS